MLFSALLGLLLLPSPTLAKAKCASKKGLAWPCDLNKGVPLDAFTEPEITAYYSWTPQPVPSPGSSIPFVPMLWGCDSQSVSTFISAVENGFALDGYTPALTKDKAILTFSEPALQSQSNCTPAEAAAVWMQHIQPLKEKGFRLGTPAVSIDNTGHAWLLEWFVQCTACTPDFMALHWYGTSFDDLQASLTGYHDAFKMPIWLTEFAAQNFTNEQHNPDPKATQPSLLQTISILNQSMAWLDSLEWLERYFWFGAMYDMQTLNPFDSLFNALDVNNRTGTLNKLGQLYVAEPAVAPKCISSAMAARPSLSAGAGAAVAIAALLATAL